MNLETISGNFYMLLYNECRNIIKGICSDFVIQKECPNISTLEEYIIKTYIPSKTSLENVQHISKRKKYVLSKEERCDAIKKDQEQCTRRKREGELYCGKHIDKQPNGVITDNIHSNIIPQQSYDPDNLPVWIEKFNNEEYLVDEENNVYTYDVENPTMIGKKLGENKMEYYTVENI